jgi:hypothetical protein
MEDDISSLMCVIDFVFQNHHIVFYYILWDYNENFQKYF